MDKWCEAFRKKGLTIKRKEGGTPNRRSTRPWKLSQYLVTLSQLPLDCPPQWSCGRSLRPHVARPGDGIIVGELGLADTLGAINTRLGAGHVNDGAADSRDRGR